MSKTLGQLSEALLLSDNDTFLVEQINIDKKTSLATIKNKMLDLIGTSGSSFAAGNHNHDGAYESLITKRSAFNVDFGSNHYTVAYGDHDHTSVYEPVITKKTAFNTDFGTSHVTVAYGDHSHTNAALTTVNIIPETTGGSGGSSLRDIGSATARYANLWSDTVHTSSITLQSDNSVRIVGSGGIMSLTASTVNISGNLIVSGTTTTVNTQQLNINDNMIMVNSNQTGTPISTLESGLEINRGSSTNYRFEFKELDDTFRIGMIGQLQAVATREDFPTSNGVAYWDNTSSSFKTSSSLTFDGSIIQGTVLTSNKVRGIDFHADAVVPTGVTQLNCEAHLYATKVYNAVWNDIADFIEVDYDILIEYGKVYVNDDKNIIRRASTRCEMGSIGIASDTYGYGLGKKNVNNEIPIAIGGFVLAHVDSQYRSGTPLTNDENGNLTEMTEEEKTKYPERMLATYFRNETKEEWNGIKVNGRNWVKVK